MKSPTEGTPRRRRRSHEEIEGLIEQYKASGRTVSEFAREKQLPVQSVYSWLRVRREEGEPAGRQGFAEVLMHGAASCNAGVVTLRTAHGWSVEVGGMDAGYVAVLFKELISCSR